MRKKLRCRQCCRPAEISAAKCKSGPRKILAAEKIRSRILSRISKNRKNRRKRAELLKCLFYLKSWTIYRIRPLNSQGLTSFFLLLSVKDSLHTPFKSAFYKKNRWFAAEFFLQRLNFSVDLAYECGNT
jgi:hypothetical protein